MTNHERIKLAFGDIRAPEGFADKILKTPETTYMRPRYKKPIAIAAVIAISLLMFGTAALAYTGVLSGIFSAITSDTEEGEVFFSTDTRREIVEQEHVVVSALPSTSVADDGSVLELIAYYADSGEMWFNFILSNADIPDYFDVATDQLLPCFFSLEIVQADGTVSKFETVIDENTERDTFPGGHIFLDRALGISEFEADNDSIIFGYNTRALLTDDGSLDITVIVTFHNRNAPIGEKAYLQIGNFMFNTSYFPDDLVMGVDESPEMYHDQLIIHRTILENIYEFEIEIDSRFTEATALRYNVVNVDEAAQHGITIHSVTVTPTITRVEATIDISKNDLMNPDYVVFHEDLTLYNYGEPVPLESLLRMNIIIYNESNASEYGFLVGFRESENENLLEGWWELSSIYFDAPENFVLVFTAYVLHIGEYTGDEVRIPLTLVR